MTNSDEVRRLAAQLAADLPAGQVGAFLNALLTDSGPSVLAAALQTPEPAVRDAPAGVSAYRIRVDLVGAKPPIWRRLELPGDLTLDRLHLVIQAAMGWSDSHLHRFRTGSDPRSAYFITAFDVEEGEDGVLEDDVRVDQLLTDKGDRLWYEYDFGDGWDHRLAVEAITDEPPAGVRCTDGRLACPPEDCGGIWGYTELAAWVRGGCDPSSVPEPFEDAEHAHGWLPPDWHPDRFDVEEANVVLGSALAEPVPVTGELAALADQLDRRGNRALGMVLARPGWRDPATVGEADAAAILEPFAVLLDAIGDGVQLTSAGYLPPAVVEQVAERVGVTGWWIGKTNREDQTWPVAQLRAAARALGLVSVRKRRLTPAAVVKRARSMVALWEHVVSRLPLGRTDFDRHAGWLSLAVIGSDIAAQDWNDEIRDLLLALGWRIDGQPFEDRLPVHNPTLDVLELLAGQAGRPRLTGPRPAVAATARAVIASTTARD